MAKPSTPAAQRTGYCPTCRVHFPVGWDNPPYAVSHRPTGETVEHFNHVTKEPVTAEPLPAARRDSTPPSRPAAQSTPALDVPAPGALI